jgi:beta-catenin-like protein 1
VDADETEFMENIFDALCSALGEPENKELFLKSEGIDLMVLMMKSVVSAIVNRYTSQLILIATYREKRESRARAIKVLDHAMSGNAGTMSCETFVEALGLKTIFSALMGKSATKKPKASAPAGEETSHILGIISSLFTNLASDSPARIRVLAKFVENSYEKVEKLLEVREGAQGRLKTVEKEIEAEKKVRSFIIKSLLFLMRFSS